jgi:hypothetical protein
MNAMPAPPAAASQENIRWFPVAFFYDSGSGVNRSAMQVNGLWNVSIH